jgi:hypothetical protein
VSTLKAGGGSRWTSFSATDRLTAWLSWFEAISRRRWGFIAGGKYVCFTVFHVDRSSCPSPSPSAADLARIRGGDEAGRMLMIDRCLL